MSNNVMDNREQRGPVKAWIVRPDFEPRECACCRNQVPGALAFEVHIPDDAYMTVMKRACCLRCARELIGLPMTEPAPVLEPRLDQSPD